jgi:hypothetical protein
MAAAKLALPWARIRSRDASAGPPAGPKTRCRAALTRSTWALKPARAPCRAATHEFAGGTSVVLVVDVDVVPGGNDVDVDEVELVDVDVVVGTVVVVDEVVVGTVVVVLDVVVDVDVVVEVDVVVGVDVVVDVLVVVGGTVVEVEVEVDVDVLVVVGTVVEVDVEVEVDVLVLVDVDVVVEDEVDVEDVDVVVEPSALTIRKPCIPMPPGAPWNWQK